jgi:hypothetical protein
MQVHEVRSAMLCARSAGNPQQLRRSHTVNGSGSYVSLKLLGVPEYCPAILMLMQTPNEPLVGS